MFFFQRLRQQHAISVIFSNGFALAMTANIIIIQ